MHNFLHTAAARYNEFILSEQLRIQVQGRAVLCTTEHPPTGVHKGHHYQPAVKRWEVIQMSEYSVELGEKQAAHVVRDTALHTPVQMQSYQPPWRTLSSACRVRFVPWGAAIPRREAPGLSLPAAARVTPHHVPSPFLPTVCKCHLRNMMYLFFPVKLTYTNKIESTYLLQVYLGTRELSSVRSLSW